MPPAGAAAQGATTHAAWHSSPGTATPPHAARSARPPPRSTRPARTPGSTAAPQRPCAARRERSGARAQQARRNCPLWTCWGQRAGGWGVGRAEATGSRSRRPEHRVGCGEQRERREAGRAPFSPLEAAADDVQAPVVRAHAEASGGQAGVVARGRAQRALLHSGPRARAHRAGPDHRCAGQRAAWFRGMLASAPVTSAGHRSTMSVVVGTQVRCKRGAAIAVAS